MTLEDGEHIYSSRGRPAWKKVADLACTILIYLLIAYVVVSWLAILFPGLGLGGVYNFIEKIVGPVMRPVRKIVPPIGGRLDISVIILYFAISFIQRRFFKR